MLDCSRVSHKSAIIKPDVQLSEFEFTKGAYYVTINQAQGMLRPDTILGSNHYMSCHVKNYRDPL
jgi:hypothetical protein